MKDWWFFNLFVIVKCGEMWYFEPESLKLDSCLCQSKTANMVIDDNCLILTIDFSNIGSGYHT